MREEEQRGAIWTGGAALLLFGCFPSSGICLASCNLFGKFSSFTVSIIEVLSPALSMGGEGCVKDFREHHRHISRRTV